MNILMQIILLKLSISEAGKIVEIFRSQIKSRSMSIRFQLG